jgi:hypothetical protein
LGLSGQVPPRVDAATKAGLLDLLEQATGQGWTVRAVCQVWRSVSCASTGGFTGVPLASWPTRPPVAARCMACWTGRSRRSSGCSRSGVRSTAPTASSPTAAPTWSGCGCRRPACTGCWSARACGCGRCRGQDGRSASRSRTGPNTGRGRSGSTTRPLHPRRGRRHRGRGPGLAQVAGRDRLGRGDSTQVQVVFCDALEAEGLLERVTARQAGLVDPTVDDPSRPVLLALSDNGPQMTSGSTREFMALCAIHQHFGRPGTPTDQAWTWVAVRPRQGRMAPPEHDPATRRPCAPSSPWCGNATTGCGCTPGSAMSRPTTNTRAAVRRSARRARPDWSRPACSGLPGTASTVNLNHPRNPAMLADQSAISIAKSETGHGSGRCGLTVGLGW